MSVKLDKLLTSIRGPSTPAVPTSTPSRNYNFAAQLGNTPNLPNVATTPAQLFAPKPLVYTPPSDRNTSLTMPTSDNTTLTQIPTRLMGVDYKAPNIPVQGIASIKTTNGTPDIFGQKREETKYTSNPIPAQQAPGYGVSNAGGIANAGGVLTHPDSARTGNVQYGTGASAGGITPGQFQPVDISQYRPVVPAAPPAPEPGPPPTDPSRAPAAVITYSNGDTYNTKTGITTNPSGVRSSNDPNWKPSPGKGGSDKRIKKNIESGDGNIKKFLDALKAYTYDYKEPEKPGRKPGKQLSVMAQDLMKSDIGKKAVSPDEEGTLMVDYNELAAPMMAAISYMNERLNKIDKGK